MLPAPILVVAKLARVFDDLGIRYVVGGSVASSVYEIPRAGHPSDREPRRAPRSILASFKTTGDAVTSAEQPTTPM